MDPLVTAALDRLLASWDRPDGPGCVLGVVMGGRLAYRHAGGLADLAAGVALEPDSPFYIASVSKQFTAACALLLAQDGVLDLDAPVRTHFPTLPSCAAPVTARHLLHHTSGLRDYLELWELSGRSFSAFIDNQQAMALLARQEGLNFPPGTRHLYCNSGYLLLAELVPRLTGQTLRDFAAQRLFAPLGMAHTFFDDANEALPGRVQSYRPAADGVEPVPKAFTIVGSGGVITTLGDLARWAAHFDTPVVGGPALVEALLTPGRLSDGTLLDYAGGLYHGHWKGLPVVRHGGGMLGFRTEMLRFPAQRLTVICLANLSTIDAYARATAVADVLLRDVYPLAPLAGAYYSRELDAVWELAVAGADLEVQRPRALAGALVPAGRDGFRRGEWRLQFHRDAADARRTALTVDAPRAQGIRFVRVVASG